MSTEELLKELRIDRAQRGDSSKQTPRWFWIAGGLLVLIAICICAAVVWPRAQQGIAVNIVKASAQASDSAAAVLQATGYVTARRQATVSAQMVGMLAEVLIEEGDRVEKGQVLARLDGSAQRAYLASAKADALAANARTEQLHTQLAQARRDADRLQDLVGRKLVAVQQAEQARMQVDTLQAQLHVAQAQAQSSVAQIAVAQINHDRTEIRAPFAGVITQKAAQVGEIVSPSAAGGGYTRTGIGTIVDMDSLEVDVDVSQTSIGRVQAGMPAEIVLDAYPGWEIPAHVVAIVPTADRGKATVKVRIGIDAKDARIVPDMGVRVSFLEGTNSHNSVGVRKGILVPVSAMTRRDGRDVFFIVEDGKARLHAVDPVVQANGGQYLLEGVAPGAEIVDRPPANLADGAHVVPVAKYSRRMQDEIHG